jgi:hypothetical protein
MGGVARRGVYGSGVAGGHRRSHRFYLVLFANLVPWWVGVSGMAVLDGWVSPVGGRLWVGGGSSGWPLPFLIFFC